MSINITWHGHANFQLESQGLRILIDPFFTGNPKADIAWEALTGVDLVLVTHSHGDHLGDAIAICKKHQAQLATVVGLAEKVLELGLPASLLCCGSGFNIGGTLTFKGVEVTMTEAFHTTEFGCPVGYIITLQNGFRVYHAGDTGLFSNLKTWGELYKINLALLPAGGFYTMDARQAALAAKFLQAEAAIPMHWGTFPVLAQEMSVFKQELAKAAPSCRPVLMQPGDTIGF
ncbi:MAG: metal-dependent hydrolase [Deltaproteobacteria bacterium]|jgi:L-ascorbate metabolism protein UlaG (beta-lactamase superfamily)|nr:metal-dependent hydrolase [Deltaproteobacteria bacterium]